MTEWLISGNPEMYNLIDAFRDLDMLEWTQSSNVEVGDIVFIYVTANVKKIMYKCSVTKANLDKAEIDDSKYYLSDKLSKTGKKYMELKLVESFDTDLFESTTLKHYGFKAPQGPVKIRNEFKEYIDVVQQLLHADEMDPDKHDGSYELARETVRAYKNMREHKGNLDEIDYCDLNLLYHMVIGTWKMNVKKKKESVDKSHLSDSEKQRLKELLDEVLQNAENKQYECRENDRASIGMFGTGFYSFVSKDEETAAKTFINACVDIFDMNDDIEIYNAVEKYFKDDIKGLKAASASAMLHCLKPCTFPILNTNSGSGTIYKYLKIDLTNPKQLTTYISNCKKIKEFRDNHFTVKNYRIYDLAAHQVNKTKSNTTIDYIGVLDYLVNSKGIPYSDPNSATDENKREQLLEVKAMGQNAVSELKAMFELCKKEFNLDKCETISWLDGSNTKTKNYLWVQMKYGSYEKTPVSISIFVEMSDNGSRARYRFALEIKNDKTPPEAIANYHKHLDLDLPVDGPLKHVSGSNEDGELLILDEDTETIKKKIAKGDYKKVQVCSIIEDDDEYSNDDYEQSMLDSVKALIPYYKYVLGITAKPEDDLWPSQEEYSVLLTKEDWKQFVDEVENDHRGCMRVLKCYLDIGGTASPKKMSERYKGHHSVYTSSIMNTCRRALEYFDMQPCPDNKTKGKTYCFPVAFQGKYGIGEDDGTYVYKMRPQLLDALKELDLAGINLEYQKGEEEMTLNQFDKNLILYGPPGTGKTYNTVKYAVAICDKKPIDTLTDYAEIMKRYKALKEEGRIAFTTFHQSYGYEEFIEGIKPILSSSNDEHNDVKYDVIPGIFKRFCEDASGKEIESKDFNISKDAEIWKVTVRDEVKQDCYDNDRVRIDWSFDSDGAYGFVNEMTSGDIIITTDGNRKCINGIAVITKDEAFELDSSKDKTTREVKWLAKNINVDITSINAGKILHRKTCARVPKMKVEEIVSIARDENKDLANTVIEDNTKPYVFIIDEINRGNISKIFGELITLIEETKRVGADEPMETILPYSGDVFSVPNNVYILGTMNTADRSIALMDTALRRRFAFEEMMPNPKVLREIGADTVGNLDVATMLERINERITFLYDREHTIGHAFFTKLKDDQTVERLASIFKNSVVPLLQEYFYEDYQKIQMILGDNEKTKEEYKFIKDTAVVAKDIFKGSVEEITDLPEKKYEINEEAFNNIQSYIEIYQ